MPSRQKRSCTILKYYQQNQWFDMDTSFITFVHCQIPPIFYIYFFSLMPFKCKLSYFLFYILLLCCQLLQTPLFKYNLDINRLLSHQLLTPSMFSAAGQRRHPPTEPLQRQLRSGGRWGEGCGGLRGPAHGSERERDGPQQLSVRTVGLLLGGPHQVMDYLFICCGLYIE